MKPNNHFVLSLVCMALGVLSPIRCKTLLDGGRRRTKNLYGVFKRTVPAGQVRQ